MDSTQRSFMLLPNFYFRPGKQLELGVLLPLSKDTKLPNPERVLNADSHVPVAPASQETFVIQEWNSDQAKARSFSTGLWAELSILTGLGAGADISPSKTNGLKIRCESMTVKWFTPSEAYIAQALKDNLVQMYLKKHIRPSVYMITGLMIAEKTVVAIANGKSKDFEGQLSVDVTQFGVPLKVGPKAGLSMEEHSNVAFRSDDPFILAYRLRRIRQKRDGSFKENEFNKWALFNDDQKGDSEESPNLIEFEDVGPETAHDA